MGIPAQFGNLKPTFNLKGAQKIVMFQTVLKAPATYRKNNLILIMTPEKQDKTLELSKHWSPDSTPARNEVIMKTTYPVNQ